MTLLCSQRAAAVAGVTPAGFGQSALHVSNYATRSTIVNSLCVIFVTQTPKSEKAVLSAFLARENGSAQRERMRRHSCKKHSGATVCARAVFWQGKTALRRGKGCGWSAIVFKLRGRHGAIAPPGCTAAPLRPARHGSTAISSIARENGSNRAHAGFRWAGGAVALAPSRSFVFGVY